VRYNGDRELVRQLVAAGVPVVAEQWIDVEGRGQMGHYRTVVGFDDINSEFIVQDSYYGPRRRYGYDDFETMWRPFLGAYVAVYTPEQAAYVEAVVGENRSDASMWETAREASEGWTRESPDDPWAWFTLGEALSHLSRHEDSVAAFDRAIGIGLPYRAFWYQFGYYQSLAALGRYERLLEHAETTLETMHWENLEESHYWRGEALRNLGRTAEARESFDRALEFNPLYAPAAAALEGLAGD
jgi:tetratricopeptide (TPR) repeat protein